MSLFSPDTVFLVPKTYYAMNFTQFSMEEQHRHSRCEIMFVLSGRCQVQTGEVEFQLTNGQYIFLDEEIPHALNIQTEKGCSILNMEFSCQKDEGYCCIRPARENSAVVRRFLSQPVPYFVAENREGFGAVLKDLISQLERGAQADRFLIGNLLERVLLELAEASGGRKEPGGLIYVRRAVAYIKENSAMPLRAEEVARAAGINRSYLQALFHREFGCGIMAYVNRVRVKNAGFLLANTRMHLVDIAAETGFNSRQNFSLVFEKLTGCAPSAVRKAEGSAVEVRTKYFEHFSV